jgi:hypothetical protein
MPVAVVREARCHWAQSISGLVVCLADGVLPCLAGLDWTGMCELDGAFTSNLFPPNQTAIDCQQKLAGWSTVPGTL